MKIKDIIIGFAFTFVVYMLNFSMLNYLAVTVSVWLPISIILTTVVVSILGHVYFTKLHRLKFVYYRALAYYALYLSLVIIVNLIIAVSVQK